MDWRLELVAIPVTDVDRAKSFYVDQVGFNADHDYQTHPLAGDMEVVERGQRGVLGPTAGSRHGAIVLPKRR